VVVFCRNVLTKLKIFGYLSLESKYIMTNEDYMKIAIDLANKGVGYTNPNPLVGAVIVKNNKVIGQGYHEKYKNPHAEINALASCTENPKDSTIYVTLEPCCHYGNTPPCTEAILKSGIRKVIVGSKDPNPKISGKGISYLKSKGIVVIENILREECDSLNEIFFHYIQTKTPYVLMKYAMTIDGKISTATGESKYISCEQSLKNVHLDRHKYSSIMVGVNTIIIDNPKLTCRINENSETDNESLKNPIRIVCDTNLRTPIDSFVVTSAKYIPTIIATSITDNDKLSIYKEQGVDFIYLDKKDNILNLNMLMKELYERNIDSILLEGGGFLNWSALNSKIVNKINAYIAPKIFGGKYAKSPITGLGISSIDDAIIVKDLSIKKIGEDFLFEGIPSS